MKRTVDEVIEILENNSPEEVQQMLEYGLLRQADIINAMSVLVARLQDNQKKVRQSLQAAIDKEQAGWYNGRY